MNSILIVEDDLRLRKAYRTFLCKNGYEVIEAGNATEALFILDKRDVDLMLCDVMMPGMDGFALVRELRKAEYKMPILLATGKSTFPSKQEGFEAGTDDYMVKPIDLNELLLRIKALLRRAKIFIENQIKIGSTTLIHDKLILDQNGNSSELPQKEFYLLYKLLSNPGIIFTRQQLMDEIWGVDSQSDTRTVDVHIVKLRERLQDNPDVAIITVRGLGYKAMVKNG